MFGPRPHLHGQGRGIDTELKNRTTIVLVTNNTKAGARVGTRTAFSLMSTWSRSAHGNNLHGAKNARTEDYIVGRFG